MHDVSGSGIKVRTRGHWLPPGADVDIVVQTGDAQPIFVKGEVVRADDDGFAARFAGGNRRLQRAIRSAQPR